MTGGPASFVGRTAEVAAIGTAVDHALVGRGGGIVVVGDAGIGKTTLVNEVVARRRDRTVAWASGAEPGGAASYWHWVQLLRALASGRDRHELVGDLGDDAAELARLVPTLRSGVDIAPAAAPEGDDPRFRLFDAVTSFLQRLSRRQPLILVLDDIHTSDIASLQLLRFALAHTRLDAIAVVATTRDGASEHLESDVDALLGEIRRGAAVLRLGGLAPGDVELLLGNHIDRSLASRLAPVVHERSGGNPLFVSELARLLVTDPDSTDVPDTIRVIVERRLAALSMATVAVLRVAAVAGELFTIDLVAAASRSDRDDIVDAVDAALRARLVVEREPGAFAFAHALIRDVLRQQLPLRDRAAAHRAVAEHLASQTRGDPPVSEIARHFLGGVIAVDDGRAAAFAERAGRLAVEQLAYEDAANHFRAALGVRLEEKRRVPLLLALGDAELRTGRIDAARIVFVEAADRARERGRADQLAQAALGLGSGLDGFEVRLFDRAQITLLREALDALPAEPSALRARGIARLSVALTFSEPDEHRRVLADEAIAMARRVADDLALAYALAARCDATAGPAHVDERFEAATEIVRLATAAGDLGLELLGRRNRVIALLERGDIPAVDAEIARYDATARTIRQPLYQWYVPLWRGMRSLMDGRVAEARAHHDVAVALGTRAASHNAALNAAVLSWNADRQEGRWDDAASGISRQLPLADGIYGEAFWVALVLPRRHPVEATAALDRLLARAFVEVPRDAVWLAAMTYAAEASGVVEHRDAAAVLYELILPYRSRFAVDAIGAACYGSMARPLGAAAAVLRRERDALEHFDEALTAHRAAGASALVAETLHDLGLALRRFGHDARSEAVLREAAAVFQSVGMEQRAGPVAARRDDAAESHVFRLAGDQWELSFDGRRVVVADSKGLRDIATLLSRPGREVHVADLIAGADPGDEVTRAAVLRASPSDRVLDDRARAAYRAKLIELRDDVEEAETNGDIHRAEAARAAMDIVAGELAAALGIGGRSRRHVDASERARKAVTQRIRNAVRRLATVHPELAAHLDRSVRTGRFCAYDPATPVTWSL